MNADKNTICTYIIHKYIPHCFNNCNLAFFNIITVAGTVIVHTSKYAEILYRTFP